MSCCAFLAHSKGDWFLGDCPRNSDPGLGTWALQGLREEWTGELVRDLAGPAHRPLWTQLLNVGGPGTGEGDSWLKSPMSDLELVGVA